MSSSLRTHTCGELTLGHVGAQVSLCGWAHAVRDRGGVLFVLLRDRYGVTQVTIGDASPAAARDAAKEVRLEYAVRVAGVVRQRDPSAVNRRMATGAIEVMATAVEVLSRTRPMPFAIGAGRASGVHGGAEGAGQGRGDSAESRRDGKRTVGDDGSSRETADASIAGGAGAASSSASEETRLKYRYLDLRRAPLQDALALRHRAAMAVRRYLDAVGFVEVETPILTRSTPEGARDYLVPSRVHRGSWYALPQSPQIYKQLLMVGGMDRYFQVSRCFRDEDLRQDRQPEFTQVDLEMSFARRRDVMDVVEGAARAMFNAGRDGGAGGGDWQTDGVGEGAGRFPVLTYREAMERFGVDAPDLRFGMELQRVAAGGGGDAQDAAIARFGPLASAAFVRALVIEGAADVTTRKVIDGYTEFVRAYGLGGLLWGKVGASDGDSSRGDERAPPAADEEGRRTARDHGRDTHGDGGAAIIAGPLSKLGDAARRLVRNLGATRGDLLLVAGGKQRAVQAGLGRLRVKIARERGLIDAHSSGDDGARYKFCWVVDFPMFEYDDEEQAEERGGADAATAVGRRLVAVHHPFTAPRADHLDRLLAATAADDENDADDGDVGDGQAGDRALPLDSIISDAYDLVCNGHEIGGGSIRIHEPHVQQCVFQALGIGAEEQRAKFGFLLDALSYGAPPHGGFAFGFDRCVMLMAGAGGIRDVIAFPKTTSASELMSGAPSVIDAAQLDELDVRRAPRDADDNGGAGGGGA